MSANYKHLILLGKSIKYFRKEKNLTQASLAMKTGVNRTYMGAIERGERNLSFTKVLEIARALDIKVLELLGFLDN